MAQQRGELRMAKLNANPTVEANAAFDIIQPGDYTMRVEEITEFVSQNSGNTCWKVRFSHVNPADCLKLDGTPAANAGALFDNGLVISPPEKQGKLRSLVEALGATWTDLDSDDLVGLECTVKVKLGEWQGDQKNEVARYLPVA
jgi:hypothetical protein